MQFTGLSVINLIASLCILTVNCEMLTSRIGKWEKLFYIMSLKNNRQLDVNYIIILN